MKPKKKSATPLPPPNSPASETSEPHSQPMPESGLSDISGNPPAAGSLPSYQPPGVAPSIPTPLPSATDESPSSTKSTRILPSLKTEEPAHPPASNDGGPLDPNGITVYDNPSGEKPREWVNCPPAKDPVQGEGGVDYLNWAAWNYNTDRFEETYTGRAQHLIRLHGDLLTPAAVERLNLLP